MKRMLKTLLALTASAVLWASQANAVLITLEPSATTGLDAGDTVTVEVWARDLGDAIVGAYDIDVLFDSDILSVLDVFADVVFGCDLGNCDIDSIAEAILGAGFVDVGEVSFLADAILAALYQDGSDFMLFSIDFVVNDDVQDGEVDFAFLWDRFNDVKCEDNQVCFPVSVPEPGTLGLLGLGLLGLGLARRRRMT